MSLRVDIQHRFADFTLDVAFEAGPGLSALFGRSGAGKSTIVNAVAGLLRADQAHISLGATVFDDARTHLGPHQRRIGYVFQDARLFPHLTVAENLDFGARFGAKPKGRDDIIAMLGLVDLLRRRPATLSGGQAQRVALGRALLCDPALLLMDEPLAALDAPRKAEIMPYLETLKSQTRIPILYVSHAVDEIARLADQLILIENGHVKAAGPMFEIMADPSFVPLFGVREAGAVLRARVTAHGDDGLSDLSVSGGTLHLMGVTAPIGAQIRLRVLAQDITLSRMRPDGISALNILPATITAIHKGEGPGVAVQVRAGQDTLLARVTARAVAQLELCEGQQIYAILKATSVAPMAISTTKEA